ncbi:MAG: polymerase [Peptococcaceae bacterium]|nr:polymerase [Peptococcaceae bacterium]
MVQWVVLAITVIILGLLIIWKPLYLVPLLGIAVALEISSTWYPDLGMIGKALGMVSLTRFTSFALILAAFVRVIFMREMRQKFGAVLKDPLTIILIIFLALGAASVVYSADSGKTVAETIRLLVLFAVFVSIALLMDKDHSLLPFHAVHWAALALAPLSFYEAFTGNLIWQAQNLMKEHTLRVNTTFVDPNIFARFLILGIVANFIIQLYTREKGTKLFYLASLSILLAQLVLTSSRGGMITLVAILIGALILLPNRKAVLWVLGLGVLCGAIVLFIRPDIWERMTLVFKNYADYNYQRLYLWKAAIAIFKDHPILGSGLGSFQTVFLRDYIALKNVADGATLSHSTILTIAAELGIVGLTVLALFWIVMLVRIFTLFGNSNVYLSMFNDFHNEYYVGAGYFLWAAAVFISSQAEGRFFEDPVLWLCCAMLVVLRFSREYKVRLD